MVFVKNGCHTWICLDFNRLTRHERTRASSRLQTKRRIDLASSSSSLFRKEDDGSINQI